MIRNYKKMKKILIVDDERAIRALIKSYLEKEGFLTIEAGDGMGAVEAAKKTDPISFFLILCFRI